MVWLNAMTGVSRPSEQTEQTQANIVNSICRQWIQNTERKREKKTVKQTVRKQSK